MKCTTCRQRPTYTCSFFWIVSNIDMTPEEAFESYRHRGVIEKTFRNIKTESDFNKVYAKSDGAFESKSVMAFMTAAIRAELSMKLKPYFSQYSSETTQTVLKELDKIKAEQIGKKYYMRYPLTSRQKQILSFFEISQNNIQDYRKCFNKGSKIFFWGGANGKKGSGKCNMKLYIM